MARRVYNWATGWFNCWHPNATRNNFDSKALSLFYRSAHQHRRTALTAVRKLFLDCGFITPLIAAFMAENKKSKWKSVIGKRLSAENFFYW